MISILIAVIITFVLTTLFGYVVHWSLHQSWAGNYNKAHMTHHLKLYPPSDFTSDKYRSAGKDSTVKTFAIAAIPIILFPVGLCVLGFISWPIMITVWVVQGSVGFIHDWLHDCFHIRNHWLSRIPVIRDIFFKWINLHYLHHVNMETNYGIFSFYWDKLFGTFWDESSPKIPR